MPRAKYLKCDVSLTKEDKVKNCDSCVDPFHLEECSGLCASEVRAIVLQKRENFFFCDECVFAFKKSPCSSTRLTDALVPPEFPFISSPTVYLQPSNDFNDVHQSFEQFLYDALIEHIVCETNEYQIKRNSRTGHLQLLTN
ncbi:unnamed protein product [Psylliodes chrysocephalus]|uniref:Uncharacterized protein n=1 Tax=Psylliodes chrysocephalus TaxID=3402493 RepID=A0A9P0G657_9CUCU|nr:unnamed protein product [Psylliodes chrysocephala]